jgi:hypothetical protein
MAIDYGSSVINGQLLPVPMDQSFSPLTYGAEFSGPGFWPRGGQYNLPPLLPSGVSMTGSSTYSPDNMTGSYVPVPTAGAVKANGKVNYLSLTKSPAPWVIILLGLSLWLLHKVHYKMK